MRISVGDNINCYEDIANLVSTKVEIYSKALKTEAESSAVETA